MEGLSKKEKGLMDMDKSGDCRGPGEGMGGGGQRGKNWDNCNRITIKNDLLKSIIVKNIIKNVNKLNLKKKKCYFLIKTDNSSEYNVLSLLKIHVHCM